jgi:branched-chain amino acid transport system substrate-binding protein
VKYIGIQLDAAFPGSRLRRVGKRVLGVVAVATTLVLAAACGSSASAGSSGGKHTYHFGVLAPLTGGTAAFGAEWKAAIDMWAAEYNSSHTATAVAADYADSKCLAASGVVGMTQLIDVKKDPYVVTGCSSVVQSIHPRSEQRKVVVMNQGGQSPNLILKGYTFNAIPLITLELQAMIPYATSTLHVNKIAVVYSNDALGTGTLPFLKTDLSNAGGSVVDAEAVDPAAVNFQSVVTKLGASHPDAIYMLMDGQQQLVNFVKQLRQGGVSVPILTYSGGLAKGLSTLPEAQGMYYTSQHLDLTDPKSVAYVNAFKAANGGKAPIPYDIDAYNAADIFGQLVDRVTAAHKSVTGENLAASIRQNPTFELVGGKIVFQADGTIAEAVDVSTVKDNATSLITTVPLSQLTSSN